MDLFTPHIKIILDPSLKTYSAEISVLVPNGCYFNGGTSLGVPPGFVIVPESEPVILHIQKHEGFCTQALKNLKFTIPFLPLTAGKTNLVAFVLVNDEVVSTGSKPIIEFAEQAVELAQTRSPVPSSGVIINSINGWINARPPEPPKLILTVNIFAPCSNYKYKFTELGPFGITGKSLLVKFEASLDDACEKRPFDGPKEFETKIDDVNQYNSVAVEFEGAILLDPLEVLQ